MLALELKLYNVNTCTSTKNPCLKTNCVYCLSYYQKKMFSMKKKRNHICLLKWSELKMHYFEWFPHTQKLRKTFEFYIAGKRVSKGSSLPDKYNAF